ncbi:hypothetical protein [Glycomyces tenuis]|nr:hypothetical protein [Glycomyces tenuis]
MRLLRSFRWPEIELYGARTRGDVKRLSVAELERLTAIATENPEWSANGRPQWLERHRGDIESVMLTVFGTEGPAVYRCMVAARLADDSKRGFTLDVSASDFDRLPDVPLSEVVSLAHMHLLGYPPQELDRDQEESWRGTERPADGEG